MWLHFSVLVFFGISAADKHHLPSSATRPRICAFACPGRKLKILLSVRQMSFCLISFPLAFGCCDMTHSSPMSTKPPFTWVYLHYHQSGRGSSDGLHQNTLSLSLSPTYLTLILWKNIQKTHLVLKHLQYIHTHSQSEKYAFTISLFYCTYMYKIKRPINNASN